MDSQLLESTSKSSWSDWEVYEGQTLEEDIHDDVWEPFNNLSQSKTETNGAVHGPLQSTEWADVFSMAEGDTAKSEDWNSVQHVSTTEITDVDDWEGFAENRATIPRCHRDDSCTNSHNVTQSLSNDKTGLTSNGTDVKSLTINNGAKLEPVRAVFKTCFELSIEYNESTIIRDREVCVCPLAVDKERLQALHKATLTPSQSTWSHCLIKDHFLLSLLAYEENDQASQGQDLDDLDLSIFETFDWTIESNNDTEEEEGDVSFSPDLMQGLLRSSNTGLDSPIQLEFDYDKAVLGLSMLTIDELVMMRDEMALKVTKQSDDLICSLQKRDTFLLETNTKNKFIAALLRVQSRKHALQQSTTANSQLTASGNLEKGSQEETRPRSRQRSLSQSFSKGLSRGITQSLVWAKTKKVSSEERNSEMYLHVVIPYKLPHNHESYSVTLLKQWIKILKAMAEKSPNLPALISSYLQSEVIGNE